MGMKQRRRAKRVGNKLKRIGWREQIFERLAKNFHNFSKVGGNLSDVSKLSILFSG